MPLKDGSPKLPVTVETSLYSTDILHFLKLIICQTRKIVFYSRPQTSSSEEIPLENDRSPKVSFMQTGGGAQSDENEEKVKEGSVDELEPFQQNKIGVKALSDREFQEEEARGQKRTLESSESTEILESTSSLSQSELPLKKKKKKIDPYQHYRIKGRENST